MKYSDDIPKKLEAYVEKSGLNFVDICSRIGLDSPQWDIFFDKYEFTVNMSILEAFKLLKCIGVRPCDLMCRKRHDMKLKKQPLRLVEVVRLIKDSYAVANKERLSELEDRVGWEMGSFLASADPLDYIVTNCVIDFVACVSIELHLDPISQIESLYDEWLSMNT